jgi:asparaginyl-tRNA synthetase
MKQIVKHLFQEYLTLDGSIVHIHGWVRNNRAQKEFGFLDINDGSYFETIQVVYEASSLESFKDIQKYRVGSAVEIKGVLIVTPSMKQPFEIKATDVVLLGDSLENYPIQPKRHTREFLRENAHLRMRTNLFNAVFRVRSLVSFAIHQFFNERNFVYVHAPIITGADTEGAGEMFRVTTLDLDKLAKGNASEVDYSKDFFGKETNLTVSGQLQVEAFAMAYNSVYTFGPTFRAENSNTQRHASEFWMIEPEIAFADLKDDMALAEDMVKYVIRYVLEKAEKEIQFFDNFVEKGLQSKLEHVVRSKFRSVTHKEAIEILIASEEAFENTPKFGSDLATEHEKYLTRHFGGPVFVIDWPKEIKAFYMRLNDDLQTVAAMDLLVPGAGELIGGSQREERLDVLIARMKEMDIDPEEYWWYLDLRRYGGCKHAGFGLGLERMVMYVTGVDNIRDVLPFPRTPKNCEF